MKHSTNANGSSKRFTLATLMAKYRDAIPVSAVTAYDFPSAKQVDRAGIDIILVGDSAAMVVQGRSTTLSITLEEMIFLSKSVKRGAHRAMIVGDLPFGSYEESEQYAVRSALKFIKEGFVDALKLEGAGEDRLAIIKAVTAAGIPVMGHIGLTPQSINILGGFKPQGKSASSAINLVESAIKLEESGCFAIVIECVPAAVARAITMAVNIPTIGIGAGNGTSGQILVYHDLLGLTEHPHHAMVAPKFCKQYAEVGKQIQTAIQSFKSDVELKRFPTLEFSPYTMPREERLKFLKDLEAIGLLDSAAAAGETDT